MGWSTAHRVEPVVVDAACGGAGGSDAAAAGTAAEDADAAAADVAADVAAACSEGRHGGEAGAGVWQNDASSESPVGRQTHSRTCRWLQPNIFFSNLFVRVNFSCQPLGNTT